MRGKIVKFWAIVSLLIGVFSLPTAAQAEFVSSETPYFAGIPLDSLASGPAGSSIHATDLVWGTTLSVYSLVASSASRVNIQLADIKWPEALQELTLLVTDLDGLWKRLDGPGSLLVDLNGPAELFVAVFARSEDRYIPGLYSLRADLLAPVPLPAAAWLLLSGLGGLGLFRRKNK